MSLITSIKRYKVIIALVNNIKYKHYCKSANKEELIIITDRCVEQLKKVTNNCASKKENLLRLTVEGGGCSGFQYKFSLDSNVNKDDRVFQKNGAKIIVDETSLQYVKGATIDYAEELIKAAFKVVNNPVAEAGCSCGASFAIKLD